KQAGQTIRREDLARTVSAALGPSPLGRDPIIMIAVSARRIGSKTTDEGIDRAIWNALIGAAVDRAAAPVGRGNKKVFEEIGREFARFISTCLPDGTSNPDNLERFCADLEPGPPPKGQQYLRQAFTRYYQSFFEVDPKQRTELQLLANLEIG